MAPSSLAPVSFALFILAARKFTPLRSSPERSSSLRLLPERSAPPWPVLRLASTSARVISAERNPALERSTCRIISWAVASEVKRFTIANASIHRPRHSTWYTPLNAWNQQTKAGPTSGPHNILTMDILYIIIGIAERLLQSPQLLWREGR